MNYASEEKLRLMQWLLPQLAEGEIIAGELPYKDVSRKADLAIIGKNRLTAIEVKGPRDNLDKIKEQLEDYQKAFLEVELAVTSKYITAVRAIAPRSVGIIELGNTSVIRRRKAQRRKNLDSQAACSWLRADDLRRLLRRPGRSMGIHDARVEAAQLFNADILTAEAIKSIYLRSSARYDQFVFERGERLSLDDVATLQLPTRIR
ncbi:sce7726 family protein [Xanthomonas euvesicatoria]|uniref:sce7726 family protein n=1 Tax=Xanthomonas euvesicatoria TaxID=456327 RepID=UPI001C47A2FB|nr:sce7726 family protein [Xanthomonas euvesicatoria]